MRNISRRKAKRSSSGFSRGGGDRPSSPEKSIYSEPKISGNTCDIRVRQGNATGLIRLVKIDHWRFHDMYFDRVGDQRVELWASYAKDHPVGTWFKLHGREMFAMFCKGVVIGASMAR